MAKHSRNKAPKHINTKGQKDNLNEEEKASVESSSDLDGASTTEVASDAEVSSPETAGAGEDTSVKEENETVANDAGSESGESELAPKDEEPKSGESELASKDGEPESKATEPASKDKESESGESDLEPKPEAKDKGSKKGKHAAVNKADEEELDQKAKQKRDKKKSKGKHSAKAVGKHSQPRIQSVPMPGVSAQEAKEKSAKLKKRFKIAGITAGAAAALCLVVYLGGVAMFATHYLPNTTVAGIDVSFRSPEEMQHLLDESVDDYSMKVVGNGLNFTVTSDAADISADSAAAADAVLTSINAWEWPALVFGKHDLTSVLADAISADGLKDVVNAEVQKINDAEDATLPVDAHVAYNTKIHQFEIVSETMGTKLNPTEVMNQVLTGVVNLQPKVVILSDALVQPKVFASDKRLASAASQANKMIKANVELKMEGYVVSHVNPDISSKWVTFTPEPKLEAVFSEEALAAWAEEVAASCSTVGAERTYTRPDGKEITVSGGVYGWQIDSSGLAEQIIAAVKAGETATIDIPVLQSGTGFKGLGGQDWGTRYVDVDLSEQYARFYGEGGDIIWEAPIVSGNPNRGNSTPTGVWSANRKASPSKLIGQMVNGAPEYETTVQYWMPFQGNMVGFHDATWQPYYGGSLYLTNGSHGCINLSYSAAQALYDIFNQGDVVVVHY